MSEGETGLSSHLADRRALAALRRSPLEAAAGPHTAPPGLVQDHFRLLHLGQAGRTGPVCSTSLSLSSLQELNLLTDYVVRRRHLTGKTSPGQDIDGEEPELHPGPDGEIVHPIFLLVSLQDQSYRPPGTSLARHLDLVMFDGHLLGQS